MDYDFANKSTGNETYDLPKMIHFIWTGSPIPDKYIKNIQSFEKNKDYEVFE